MINPPESLLPHILLLLNDGEQLEQLVTLLNDEYEVTVAENTDSLDTSFDLCIVDGPVLVNLGAKIVARKEKERVPFLPFLLVTSRDDLPSLSNYIKYAVDEILLTPVDRLILQPRVETMLRTRYLVAQVQLLADIDELTGLLTRRRFFQLARHEFMRSRRYKRPLCAVMLDIDLFKNVNDLYGHQVGDQVLKVVASRCQKSIRSIDILGRYGGEEFALLLPELDLDGAQKVAERLRRVVAEKPVETQAGPQNITISLGIARLKQSMAGFEDLLVRADKALYRAKRAGRNRVST